MHCTEVLPRWCPRAPSPCATRAFPTGKRGREVGGSCEKGSRGSRSDDRWRRRRSGGASDRTRARRTPPRHAMLPHLGVMLRRRARRGERGEKKVCEAQATKGGLGLSVSLRRRACTRLCLLLQLQSAKCTPLIRLQFRGTSRARSERYKAVGPPRESRWNVVGDGRKCRNFCSSPKPKATQRRALSIDDDAVETMHAPRALPSLR